MTKKKIEISNRNLYARNTNYQFTLTYKKYISQLHVSKKNSIPCITNTIRVLNCVLLEKLKYKFQIITEYWKL